MALSLLTDIECVRRTREQRTTQMSEESTLTSKGQTTIPKGIRERLAMKSGDRMTFTLMPDGTVLMRVKNKSILGMAGALRKKGRRAVPVDQLSR